MDKFTLYKMEENLTLDFVYLQRKYPKPENLLQANREVFAHIKDLYQQLEESQKKQIAMENAMPSLIAEVHQSMRGIEQSLDKFRRGSFRKENKEDKRG